MPARSVRLQRQIYRLSHECSRLKRKAPRSRGYLFSVRGSFPSKIEENSVMGDEQDSSTSRTENKQNAFEDGGQIWWQILRGHRNEEGRRRSVTRCECSRITNIEEGKGLQGFMKQQAKKERAREKEREGGRREKKERELSLTQKARELYKSRAFSRTPSRNFALIKRNSKSFSSFALSSELPYCGHGTRCIQIQPNVTARCVLAAKEIFPIIPMKMRNRHNLSAKCEFSWNLSTASIIFFNYIFERANGKRKLPNA